MVPNGESPRLRCLLGLPILLLITGCSERPTIEIPAPDQAGPAIHDSVCTRLYQDEVEAVPGLELMGTAGGYSFFGKPREILCSEPSAGGEGECELVGTTIVKVERDSEVYGLKRTGGVATLLRYSPEGVRCVRARSR